MTRNSMSQDATKISIITPSFNQGEFLEKTIQNILTHSYPNVEYIKKVQPSESLKHK